jgi:hypothetical protein
VFKLSVPQSSTFTHPVVLYHTAKKGELNIKVSSCFLRSLSKKPFNFLIFVYIVIDYVNLTLLHCNLF